MVAPMNRSEFKRYLILRARNDINRALDLAIDEIARRGDMVSAGYARQNPYEEVRLPKPRAESIDDPEPENPECASPHA